MLKKYIGTLCLCLFSTLIFAQAETDKLTHNREWMLSCTAGGNTTEMLFYFEVAAQVTEKNYLVTIWKDGLEADKKSFTFSRLYDYETFKKSVVQKVKEIDGSCGDVVNDNFYHNLYFEINQSLHGAVEEESKAGELRLNNTTVGYIPLLATDEELVDKYGQVLKAIDKGFKDFEASENKKIKDENAKNALLAPFAAPMGFITLTGLNKQEVNQYGPALVQVVTPLQGGAKRVDELMSKKQVKALREAIKIDISLRALMTKQDAAMTDMDKLYTYLTDEFMGVKKIGGGRSKMRNKLRKLIKIFYEGYAYKLNIKAGTELKFEDGMLDEVKIVSAGIEGENADSKKYDKKDEMIFTSGSPLPFSSFPDFRNLRGFRIFDKSKKYYIDLGDLIYYNPKLRVNSYDKSPANGIVEFEKGDLTIKVYKEPFKKLIQATIFTDLVGIDNDKPNGLIQTEINRQINTWSYRAGRHKERANAGFFTYVKPMAILTKIDNKARRMPVSNGIDISSGILLKRPYATTLSLIEYMNFYTGVEFNSLIMSLPNGKTRAYLNHVVGFGRTALRDSLKVLNAGVIENRSPQEYGANLVMVTPAQVVVRFFPDERIGFDVKQSINYVYSASHNFKQVVNADDYVYDNNLGGSNRFWYGTSEIYGYVDFLTFAKVFARYRYNFQLGDAKTNYHQAQIGFAIDLMGSLSAYKKPKASADK